MVFSQFGLPFRVDRFDHLALLSPPGFGLHDECLPVDFHLETFRLSLSVETHHLKRSPPRHSQNDVKCSSHGHDVGQCPVNQSGRHLNFHRGHSIEMLGTAISHFDSDRGSRGHGLPSLQLYRSLVHKVTASTRIHQHFEVSFPFQYGSTKMRQWECFSVQLLLSLLPQSHWCVKHYTFSGLLWFVVRLSTQDDVGVLRCHAVCEQPVEVNLLDLLLCVGVNLPSAVVTQLHHYRRVVPSMLHRRIISRRRGIPDFTKSVQQPPIYLVRITHRSRSSWISYILRDLITSLLWLHLVLGVIHQSFQNLINGHLLLPTNSGAILKCFPGGFNAQAPLIGQPLPLLEVSNRVSNLLASVAR